MKKAIKFTSLLILSLLLSIYSCSNDDSVVITLENLEVTIDENVVVNQIIGIVQSDSNSALTFSIDSQAPSGALNIDSSNGELTVANASLFDFETNPTITATVSASEASNTAMVTIDLVNISEVSIQNFEIEIDENPTNGQSIGTIQATGGLVSGFSIESQTPAGALSIDATTGELTVADAALFDFELGDLIVANITANDAINLGLAEIELNNVLEVIIDEFDESIDENPSNGQIIGTITSNANGNPNYSIVSQTPAGAMAINSTTGELTVADASLFDHEINQFVDAVIAADDAMNTTNFELAIDNVYEIGDVAFGGIIFWIDPTSNNSSGLVVAIDGLSGSTTWGCDGTFTGATGTAIGTGASNTATAVAAGCANPGSAIELASNLDINGFDDWFLPSLDEWNELDANFSVVGPAIQANGGGPFFSSNWSSTEANSTNTFAVFLGGTSPLSIAKTANFSVRAVRAWSDL